MEEDDLAPRNVLIILLLGVIDRPISRFHLQKELFILTNVRPKLKELINFDKHHMGVYSVELNELVDDLSVKEYIEIKDSKIRLNEKGKNCYKEIRNRYSYDEKFNDLLIKMKMIRELYDRLTIEEFAILLYTRYEETIEGSTLIDRLDNNKKRKIIEDLYRKDYITKERYKELLDNKILFAV